LTKAATLDYREPTSETQKIRQEVADYDKNSKLKQEQKLKIHETTSNHDLMPVAKSAEKNDTRKSRTDEKNKN